jgi:hypothetical protein
MFSQKKLFLLFAFFCCGNLFSAVETVGNEDALFQEDIQVEDEAFDTIEEIVIPVDQEVVEQEAVDSGVVLEEEARHEASVAGVAPIIDITEVDDQSSDSSDTTVLDDAAIGAGAAGLLTAAAFAAPKLKTITQAGKDIAEILRGDKLSEDDKKKLMDKNIRYQEKLVYTRTKDAEEKIKQYHDAGDTVNEDKWRRRLDAVLESDQSLREQKAIQEKLNRDTYEKRLTPEAKRDLTSLHIEAARKVYDAEQKQLFASLRKYDDKDSLTKAEKKKKENKKASKEKIKKYDYRLQKLSEQNIKEHEKELKRKARTKRIVARGARAYGR